MAKRKRSKQVVTFITDPKKPDTTGYVPGSYEGQVEVGTKFLKIHTDSLDSLYRLDKMPLKLFIFLCVEANDSNRVNTGATTINKFLLTLKKLGIEASIRHIQGSIKALEDEGFILRTSKGDGIINPMYYFKVFDEEKRMNTIKYYMEELHKSNKKRFAKLSIVPGLEALLDKNDPV